LINLLSNAPASRRTQWRIVILSLLMITFVGSMTAVVAYHAFSPVGGVTLRVGEVTPEDIRAPRSITYESEILTQLSRQAAEDNVRPIYDPPDRSVLRQQVQLARHTLDFIEDIRSDPFADNDERVSDLSALTTIKADAGTFTSLLNLTEADWKTLDAQVMQILERTMRDEIRDNTLGDVYANLPNLVSVAIDEPQASLIVMLTKNLIRPNSFLNQARTEAARATAREGVATEKRSFVQGQIVIRGGQIASAVDIEALTQLGLLQPADQRGPILLSAALIVTLLTAISLSYMQRFYNDLLMNLDEMALIGVLMLLFLMGARMFGTADIFQSHLYPAAAFALVIVAIVNPQITVVLTTILALLIGIIANNSLELTMITAIGGIVGVLTLRRVERLNAYFLAGLTIGVTNIGIALVFLLAQGNPEPTRLLSVTVAGLINGMLSAGVGLVGLYLASNILNLPTSVRLLELSQPSQPLLQRLLREAPGTYQHSLQVANLAELACERIGANATLVRVAALYHDIGKMIAPHYFVENQADGLNPHDQVKDPVRSAQIIISHVTEGEKMARKHRLPEEMIDLILQHHGTSFVLYFYNKALETANGDETKLDKKQFTYPGPRPQTREAGVLMLADTCESVVRAKRPRTKQEVASIVSEIFQGRLSEHQLDESNLTLNDLNTVREVFISTLQGVFHPRIAYPAPTMTQELKAVTIPPALTANTQTTNGVNIINADDFE
jgi:putative nucleotidyltransferase with HDIG domain